MSPMPYFFLCRTNVVKKVRRAVSILLNIHKQPSTLNCYRFRRHSKISYRTLLFQLPARIYSYRLLGNLRRSLTVTADICAIYGPCSLRNKTGQLGNFEVGRYVITHASPAAIS